MFICGLFLFGCRPKPPTPAPPPDGILFPHDTQSATQPAIQPTTQATTRNVLDVSAAMALIDNRDNWETLPPLMIPRDPAEKFLKGLVIVIDPGHGGTDGGNISTRPANYKAGRRGEREANINLRVALLLERLLQDAGVHVTMTRHGDDTLSLTERAEVANNVKRPDGGIGADLLISIHHNAGSRTSNYPSVFFHGEVASNEPDADIARYIGLELGRHMRTQVAKTSPIFTSHVMYPRGGFGVLRQCNVPAVLTESSFFSYPPEESRLREPVYNLREAYAIYAGLCNWAYAGRPTQSKPTIKISGDGQVQLTTTLDEGLPNWWGSDRNRIVNSSIEVTLDGVIAEHVFDETSKTLTAVLPSSAARGEHVVVIHHANFLKNHNWPQRYEIKTDEKGVMTVKQLPAFRGSRPTTSPSTTPDSLLTTRPTTLRGR